jgi:phosphatidylserine decarboxylase
LTTSHRACPGEDKARRSFKLFDILKETESSMRQRRLAIQLEQFRQAKRIHGGLLRLMIALVGIKLSRLPIPSKRLRLSVYRGVFNKKYPPGLDEQEADKPLGEYASLNAMFTRAIKPEFRPIPAGTPQFLSPCDGTVQDLGRVAKGKLLTLKGIDYTLTSLLPGIDHKQFEGGHYAVIFLSPIDCHRVFSPQDGQLEQVTHVPGFRLLVHPPYQRAEFPVYSLNERMILRISTVLGPCLLVMVAGFGVGNITLPLAPGFRPHPKAAASRLWSPPPQVRRGEWVATFELGSTVVLFMPPMPNVTPLVASNEEVNYGQPIFAYPD